MEAIRKNIDFELEEWEEFLRENVSIFVFIQFHSVRCIESTMDRYPVGLRLGFAGVNGEYPLLSLI